MWTWSNHQKNTNKSPFQEPQHRQGSTEKPGAGLISTETALTSAKSCLLCVCKPGRWGRMLEGFYSGRKFASHVSHWVLWVDGMGGGNDGEKPQFIPSVFVGRPMCSRSQQSVLEVVAETCPASKNSKSKRTDKILRFGYIRNRRHC